MAAAGPMSNLALALIFGMLLRIIVAASSGGVVAILASSAIIQIVAMIVFINILLAVFNLMPIPPLDGSKILLALFPGRSYEIRRFFEKYGLILVILFIFFLWQFIYPVITLLFSLITGVAI